MKQDTIAAIATPPGTGGVAVIRISGEQAPAVLRRVFLHEGELEHARMAYGRVAQNGELLDRCYGVLFRAPKSFTGEHVAELHCHGGAANTARLLRAVLQGGARIAEPGEFTKRAFLNGKLDLSQAEAVCDFIGAAGERSAEISLRQMEGELKNAALRCQDALTDALARTEAAVEYPEEDLEPAAAREALPVLEELRDALLGMERTYAYGRVVKEGFCVAIAGKPNVGKSSLLNALVGFDRAIVTERPGTTRDTVEHSFSANGLLINLTDTAGIRRSEDEAEAIGVERSINASNQSDLIVFVLDSSREIDEKDHFARNQLKGSEVGVLIVMNKIDLSERLSEADVSRAFGDAEIVRVSAKTGEGVESLKEALCRRALVGEAEGEGVVITNARHRQAVGAAARQIGDAVAALREGMDMDCVTIDLRAAWRSLGELTGATASEEIIDRIFERFCLGK